jgi:hypothetical protein
VKYECVENFDDVVHSCYSEDPILIASYHDQAGMTLNGCVSDTIEVLRESGTKFFVMKEDNEVVGYFGSAVRDFGWNILSTIFVRPKYRNRESLKEFWDIINNYFESKVFLTFIYSQNAPADRFFSRHCNLKEKISQDDKHLIMFKFN